MQFRKNLSINRTARACITTYIQSIHSMSKFAPRTQLETMRTHLDHCTGGNELALGKEHAHVISQIFETHPHLQYYGKVIQQYSITYSDSL